MKLGGLLLIGAVVAPGFWKLLAWSIVGWIIGAEAIVLLAAWIARALSWTA